MINIYVKDLVRKLCCLVSFTMNSFVDSERHELRLDFINALRACLLDQCPFTLPSFINWKLIIARLSFTNEISSSNPPQSIAW